MLLPEEKEEEKEIRWLLQIQEGNLQEQEFEIR
jgi:hypothetical protein